MKFILGIIVGALVAFPLAHNLGAGKHVFSNPLEEKSLMDRTMDLASDISTKTGKSFDESMSDIKKAINDATK